MRHQDHSPALAILFSTLLISTLACTDSGDAPDRDAATGMAGGSVDASVLEVLEWRPIGPWRGGKSIAGAGHPTEPGVFYMGSTNGGGVWRTDDAGVSWHNLSDGYFGTTTVSSLAIAESNPDILYVGTGGCLLPHEHLARRRHLPLLRRRALVAEHGVGRHPEPLRDRDPSAGRESRLRRLARARVHPGREPGRVPLARWRGHMGAGAVHRR